MSEALLKALGHLVRREGARLIAAPFEVRELGQLLQVLAAHRAALGVEVELSRARLTGVSRLETQSATVVAEAGVRLGALEHQLAAEGLTLGHLSPGARALDVAGFLEGPYAGLRSVEGGRLEPVPMALEAMLSDGRLLRTHASPRSATGPDLMAVVLGGGGRLALLTSATLRCFPRHREHRIASWRFPSTQAALRCLGDALDDGALPASVHLYRDGDSTRLTATFHGEAGQVERDLDTLSLRALAVHAIGAVAEPPDAGADGGARTAPPEVGFQPDSGSMRTAPAPAFIPAGPGISRTLQRALRLLERSRRALTAQRRGVPAPRPSAATAEPATVPVPLGAERELSWREIEANLEAGRALTLYRLAHASCVVIGALEGGLLLSSPVSPSPLQSAFDPHAVLSGAPPS